MKEEEKRFTTLARTPYLEAIRLVLRTIDYHNRMMLEDKKNFIFHEKQAIRLKNWIADMKEFIHKEEGR